MELFSQGQLEAIAGKLYCSRGRLRATVGGNCYAT